MEYGIFHDWLQPGKDQSWTGEFVYLGTLDECVAEMKRQQAAHPKWSLSLHCMGHQVHFETPDEKFMREFDPRKKVTYLPGPVGKTGPGRRAR
jgi:hypothetical protein